jgi:hypothetical protein
MGNNDSSIVTDGMETINKQIKNSNEYKIHVDIPKGNYIISNLNVINDNFQYVMIMIGAQSIKADLSHKTWIIKQKIPMFGITDICQIVIGKSISSGNTNDIKISYEKAFVPTLIVQKTKSKLFDCDGISYQKGNAM